jgi:hypothetical protein
MASNIVKAKGSTMPARQKPTRKRPVSLRVMVTVAERRELKLAAAKADVPLATLMRTLVMAAVRRGETVGLDAKAA